MGEHCVCAGNCRAGSGSCQAVCLLYRQVRGLYEKMGETIRIPDHQDSGGNRAHPHLMGINCDGSDSRNLKVKFLSIFQEGEYQTSECGINMKMDSFLPS